MPGTGQDQRRLPHPLEPLTEDEVRATAAAVRAQPEFADGSVFVYIWLWSRPRRRWPTTS